MRFRILGPVRARRASDGWIRVSASQQRVVLAVLLAEAGHTVSTDQLVDAVWPDRPPRGAVNTVQVYVMRLRRQIGDDTVATRGHGYELLADARDIDADAFERLVVAGRHDLAEGRAQPACAKLARAIALWRGPAFADVPPVTALIPRAAHLELLRLSTEEDHAAAMLSLGRHEHVVDDLTRLADLSPLRERRWVLLMRALHRSGRRAEALAVFHRARLVLRDELGIEPNAELQALQRMILDPRVAERPALAGV
jgi:DNA-binding SARP family transcriptional activator